jgi:hypothetical protein
MRFGLLRAGVLDVQDGLRFSAQQALQAGQIAPGGAAAVARQVGGDAQQPRAKRACRVEPLQ